MWNFLDSKSLAVVALLLGALAIVGVDSSESSVDLDAVAEAWGDVLSDADQFGMRLTRVSAADEMELGRRLSSEFASSAAHPLDSYVAAVGQELTRNIERHDIQYRFRVVESGVINAFALPGGNVFITTGMMQFLESEAELAAILGHEIAHVDLRHCIERFQYELAAGDVGRAAEAMRRVAGQGYARFQEVDADLHGIYLSMRAGYDPAAGQAVFDRFTAQHEPESGPRPRTPVGELARVTIATAGDYLRSHPPSTSRSRRVSQLLERIRSREQGAAVYVGRENYRTRTPRSRRFIPAESRTL